MRVRGGDGVADRRSVDPLGAPDRLARLAPAMATRGVVLGVGGAGLCALAGAGPGLLTAAGGALAFVLALVLVLRPGDPAGPRRSVRRALAAPAGAVAEQASRSVTRAVVQAAPGVVVAAELTMLAAPWPVAAAMPGADLLALAAGDLRIALAARREEERTGARVLVRTSWTRGMLPLPGVRRARPRDVYAERRAPALPAPAPTTRRPPVWLIGSGSPGADGSGGPPRPGA